MLTKRGVPVPGPAAPRAAASGVGLLPAGAVRGRPAQVPTVSSTPSRGVLKEYCSPKFPSQKLQ